MTHVLYVLGNFPTLSETFIINELNEIERSNLHKKMQALGLEARPARPARSRSDEEDA